MVYVEHGALGSFGEDVLALGKGLVDFYLGVGEVELAHVLYAFHPELLFLGDVVVGVVEVCENLLVTLFECLVFLLEVFEYVAYAQAYAAGFVAVGGADAFACGAYFVFAFGGFVGAVEDAVGGEYEVGAPADVETVFDLIACAFEFTGFGHEEVGGYDAAVADDVELALVEDA